VVPVQAQADQQTTSCVSWNLAADFRTSPNQENPNRDSCDDLDTWNFMESASLTRDPASYTLLPNFTNSGMMDGPILGLNYWQGTYTDPWGTYPYIGYNASGATQSPSFPVWPPETIALHPAPSRMPIIGWRSPLTGDVSVTGSVSDIHPSCGDGILWYIDKNATNLASGSINNNSQAFSSGAGGTELNTVAVNAGDMLYVIIHPNGDISCDSTNLDLSINVVNTPTSTPSTTPVPPTSTPFGCNNWNLVSDFRISPNQENPNRDSCNNPDIWSFMESADLTRNPANYTLLPNFTDSGVMGNPIPGLNYWQGTYTDPWGTYPYIGYNATGTTQTSSFPVWPPETIALHPAPSRMPIIGWRSPLTGYVTVTGTVIDAHQGCGDGVSWYIDRNATNLASGSINNNSQAFSSGSGGAGLNVVSVNIGDILYLIIHPNGSIDCDTTRVDLSINITNPPTSTPTATLTSTPTNTATFTPTFTPTNTPTPTNTATITPTSTPTFTPTITPTNTFVPGTPHSNGSGTCWLSTIPWATYTVYYDILTSNIPGNIAEGDWVASVEGAAQTWNSVVPSNFTFIRQIGSNNSVRWEVPDDATNLASAKGQQLTGFIPDSYIKVNPNYIWDVNNASDPNTPGNNGSTFSHNIQDVVTHELGHWLLLKDIKATGCSHVTMYGWFDVGEVFRIDLDIADINAINWQYP
jgi:hypothetical protein